MNKLLGVIVTAVIALVVAEAAAPVLLHLLQGLVPAVAVVGVVAVVGRVVWYLTSRG